MGRDGPRKKQSKQVGSAAASAKKARRLAEQQRVEEGEARGGACLVIAKMMRHVCCRTRRRDAYKWISSLLSPLPLSSLLGSLSSALSSLLSACLSLSPCLRLTECARFGIPRLAGGGAGRADGADEHAARPLQREGGRRDARHRGAASAGRHRSSLLPAHSALRTPPFTPPFTPTCTLILTSHLTSHTSLHTFKACSLVCGCSPTSAPSLTPLRPSECACFARRRTFDRA